MASCGAPDPGKKCQEDSCSRHGTCDDSLGQLGCECDPGYGGAACTDCAPGYRDYGDGACQLGDPCATNTSCAGQHRACANQQGTAACGACVAGHHEESGSCVADQTCLDSSCNHHGQCEDATGVVTCLCELEYADAHCGQCATGFLHWPPSDAACVDDPCQPDPCTMAHAAPAGCAPTDVSSYACTCEDGYSWSDGACVLSCTDLDGDGFGLGAACLGPDCKDDDALVHPGATEACNGADDDCNPATADGSGDPLVGTDCDGSDSDLCKEGKWFCSSGTLQCSDASDSNPDVCNGLDDDCNPATADGSGDPLVGTSCDGIDSDLCQEGTWFCSSGTLQCSDVSANNPDLCNGLDDDCNPATADGSGDPLVGTSCDGSDSDLCQEGTWFCSSGTLQCSDLSGDTLEVCGDGLDNDCNGLTDDGC
ncbi:MAG TPA: putative metal-binding motif-containing protein [Myxococcales bacterium]